MKSRFAKRAFGSLSLKIAHNGLAFVIGVLQARLIGSEGVGIYAFTFSYLKLLSIPANLGLDQLLIREVAILNSRSEWSKLHGLLKWSALIGLTNSILIGLFAFGIAWLATTIALSKELLIAFGIVFLLGLPLNTLSSLNFGIMKGLQKIVLGDSVQYFFEPVIVIVAICGSYIYLGTDINVYWILICKIFGMFISLFLGIICISKNILEDCQKSTPTYEKSFWMKGGFNFLLTGTLKIITSRTDILMLGFLSGIDTVGVYAVVVRITTITQMMSLSVSNSVAPNIAKLFSEKNTVRIQEISNKVVQVMFGISLAVTILFILAGPTILAIFGPEFSNGYSAIIILCLGYVLVSATGMAGIVLAMTGHEKFIAKAHSIAAIVNIALNYLFIPLYGINGAAVATTISMVIANISKMLYAYKKLQISTCIVPLNKF